MRRRVLAVAGVLALTLPSTAALAATGDGDPSSRFRDSSSRGAIDSSFSPASLDPTAQVTVIVEMTGDPVAVVEAEKDGELSDGEKSRIQSDLEQAQNPVADAIVDAGGEVQAQMQSAYNGIQATIPAQALDTVAATDGVVAIHPVRSYSIDNAVSVPFLGLPQVWQHTGYTGEGIKLAVIDTGIDYTHATFGGPGTVEAFEAAAAVSDQPADPALFGPDAPRVKGGVDLVGDDYDADPSSSTYKPVPHPDDNPLDCQGHGSHVAGTAGGGGVSLDGTGFTGPYDESTPSQTFRVGPGTAPQVDLYAVRVFGCGGSTEMVVPALDWAVAHGMDVVNLSLGSPFGRGDDPDAVAATNAVGAGVVVIASAGNEGHNPYLTGSPGAGDGVVSVSAVDSTAGFPGATIDVDGTAVEAINANGASLEGLGALSVVVVGDDPTTPENESLGCSAEAYTKAGIVTGSGQLAVVQRGVCARAAKPIFGQQAGAAAVLMVNNTADLPPYEGVIAANPDTGEEFLVTIPFLGVRSTDGPALVADATATLTATDIANPAFRAYAEFTSSGPRSGDSAISPDVAAPGVSIASAGVGTGNGVAVSSGTSMAAPHVAGIAALSAQAHPDWSAPQVAASLVSTADPDRIAGHDGVVGGLGLIDAAQAVATTTTATGDAFRTESGWARESALSFGFQESILGFVGLKTVTVHNHGTAPVTYKVSTAAAPQSLKAKVRLSTTSLTVRPGRTGTVVLALTAAAGDVPTSLAGDDQFSFYEMSGQIVLSAPESTLRVPYLLVPRSNSAVGHGTGALFSKKQPVADATKKVTLRNLLGALDAGADVYTWGLSDPKDATSALPDNGYDIRAAGVQTVGEGDDRMLVFAINTHRRWSNAAGNEYDVVIDVDRDGQPDWVVFSYDSGAVRTGSADGVAETFIADARTGAIAASGFLTQAPTDSSTLLLPVAAADLGITGAFDYTVQTFGLSGGEDEADGWATYDPSARALSDGQFVTVPKRGSASVLIDVNAAAYEAQKPLGSMVVVLDNASGPAEALLVKVRD